MMPLKINNGKNIFFEYLLIAFVITLPFSLYFFTVANFSYVAFNNSSDSFLYLDIAKNISSGLGPVVSFNIYRFWPGVFYPALPYVHVVFPLVLSLFYSITCCTQALFFFNLVIGFFNIILIYKIVKKVYGDSLVALWTALLVATSVSTAMTVIRLLTEQISLTVTLLTMIFFISYRRFSAWRVFVVASILALGVFVRSATIYYPFVFVFAILFSRLENRHKIKEALILFLWPIIIIGLYEWFVLLKFGFLFPQYPAAFKNYYLATYFLGGDFFNQLPVTRIPEGVFVIPGYAWKNLVEMCFVVFCMLRIFVFFIPSAFIRTIKEKRHEELLFFWMVIIQTSAVIFYYRFFDIAEMDWVRFLLVPIIFLAAMAIREFSLFCGRLFPRTKTLLFNAALCIVLASNFYQTYETLKVYWTEAALRPQKIEELKKIEGWIKDNTDDLALIAASEYVLGKVYFDRPCVNLPEYNLLNDNNLSSFLSIYKPEAVVFQRDLGLGQKLEGAGYKKRDILGPESYFLIYYRRPLT